MLSKLYKTIHSQKNLRFLSYNILYDVIMNNTLDIHNHLVVAQHHITERCIQHALLVVEAVRSIDYLYYLKLMETAPKYGRMLMELYLPTIRRRALKLFLVSLFPSIEVAQLAVIIPLVFSCSVWCRFRTKSAWSFCSPTELLQQIEWISKQTALQFSKCLFAMFVFNKCEI